MLGATLFLQYVLQYIKCILHRPHCLATADWRALAGCCMGLCPCLLVLASLHQVKKDISSLQVWPVLWKPGRERGRRVRVGRGGDQSREQVR